MHHLTLEVLSTLNIRILRTIQLADTRNQKVGRDGVLGVELAVLLVRHCNLDFPFLILVVPAAPFDLRVEPDVLVQVPFLRDGVEILEDLFLTGVLASPIWLLLERVAVEVAPDVARAALVLFSITREL